MAEQETSGAGYKLTVVVLAVVIVILAGLILFLLNRPSGRDGVIMIPPGQQVCPPLPATSTP